MRSYKYADMVIGNSYGNIIDLVNNYQIKPEKTVVINNFYNTEEVIRLSQEKLNSSFENIFLKHKTITFVSRFDNKKGHLHLIRILSELKKEGKVVKLFFIRRRRI